MPYAQIDTEALTHPKIAGLSDGAFRVWVAALAYCQRHLTDGALPADGLHALGVKVHPKACDELVAKRLWERTEQGFSVHDYLAWNTSRAEVEAKRAEARERMARRRAGGSGGSGGGSTVRTNNARTTQERSQNVPYSVRVHRTSELPGEGEPERGDRPSGHQNHTFCGRRFCVPTWLDAEFRAGIGPDALEHYDLDAWYGTLDEEMATSGKPLLPDAKSWLQAQYRDVLRQTFGEPKLRRVR